MPLADFGAQSFAGILVGLVVVPPTLYLALCTDEPGSGWDGTALQTVEPVDPGVYTRPAIPTSTGWVLSDGGYVSQASDTVFPTPVLDWGLITHWALLDDPVAGQLWVYEQFDESVQVLAGSDLFIPASSLVLAFMDAAPAIAEP